MAEPQAFRGGPHGETDRTRGCSVFGLTAARHGALSTALVLLPVQSPARQPAWASAPGGFGGGRMFQVFERTVNKVGSHHPRAHM